MDNYYNQAGSIAQMLLVSELRSRTFCRGVMGLRPNDVVGEKMDMLAAPYTCEDNQGEIAPCRKSPISPGYSSV